MKGERSSIGGRARSAVLARKDNRALRTLYKARQLSRSSAAARARPFEALRFLISSREVSNYTYENRNPGEMHAAVAAACGVTAGEVAALDAELDADEEFTVMLRERLLSRADRNDEPLFGYRRISYLLVRLRRPRRVVECGTHDGLGSSVILRALQRNAADGGEDGVLRSCDLSPGAGWLVDPSLRQGFEQLPGDAVELLPQLLEGGVDLFVEDFGYAFPHKARFLEAAADASGPGGLAIVTEVDRSPVLDELVAARGGSAGVFREDPAEHWWAGHEWGVAVLPPRS